jgi:hypothetical protein
MYRTLHKLTLIFPNSTESAGLAAKYSYDKWVVGHFLEYVPEVRFFVHDGETTNVVYSSQHT